MSRGILTAAASACLDLSEYRFDVGDAAPHLPQELLEAVASRLTGEPGFCIAYGVSGVLSRQGIDISEHQGRAHDLLESVFRGAMARIDLPRYAVVLAPMELAWMDVDGYNLNQSFSHDGNIAARAFMTAKCIHFDAATPFIANTYGLNENIGGGLPLVCDVRQYCRDRGIDPRAIVEPIANNYNVAIRREVYETLRDEYSVAFDLPLDSDMAMVMLFNEIAGGLAHGATPPCKLDPSRPARRPIRHYEYQFGREEHYEQWYAHYEVPMVTARDYAGENLSLDYYGPSARPFDRIVRPGV
jgi:hypothetical protein